MAAHAGWTAGCHTEECAVGVAVTLVALTTMVSCGSALGLGCWLARTKRISRQTAAVLYAVSFLACPALAFAFVCALDPTFRDTPFLMVVIFHGTASTVVLAASGILFGGVRLFRKWVGRVRASPTGMDDVLIWSVVGLLAVAGVSIVALVFASVFRLR